MDDLGAPVSHLALRDGVPAYDRNGQDVGVVDRVMTDEGTGISEGLIIHTRVDREPDTVLAQLADLVVAGDRCIPPTSGR